MTYRLLVSILLIVMHAVHAEGDINIANHSLYKNFVEREISISTRYTAGGTMCRQDSNCGFHVGTSYSWCYVDYSDDWDYCCTAQCIWRIGKGGKPKCVSGNTFQYCSAPDDDAKDVDLRPCLPTHPCGIHNEGGTSEYYWCYVDLNRNWGFCCSPFVPCAKYGRSYYWCDAGTDASLDPETEYTHFEFCKV
ncbi:hypothetical protein CHS0354_014874 [Potamilus streckersoni]|uniref:Uncharacterized protein n=1 Tax=Potamilus streckersoni TaxID=2493646 RepID=A0AAE0TIU1_9BIVA|nr:hypothetical protein CHS0354_014874 [Potamilus streckersoni]